MVFEKKIPNQDLRSRLDSPVVCAFTILKSARVSLEVLADSAEISLYDGLILDRNLDRSRCTLNTVEEVPMASYNRRAEGHRAPYRGRSDLQWANVFGEHREENLVTEEEQSHRVARERLRQRGRSHERVLDRENRS